MDCAQLSSWASPLRIPSGPRDVAGPIHVFILHYFAYELRAALAEPPRALARSEGAHFPKLCLDEAEAGRPRPSWRPLARVDASPGPMARGQGPRQASPPRGPP